MTTKIVADSAFGCAGQRCLASSVVITVAEAEKTFTQQISDAAVISKSRLRHGQGHRDGPGDLRREQDSRIEGLIAQGVAAGAKPLVDGRNARVDGYDHGNFLRPTVLADVDPASELARTEVFGPVLSVMRADDVDAAIAMVNGSAFGNMACLFTRAAPLRVSSVTRRASATSASTSAWPHRWRTSRSRGGRTASSATCTRRDAMRSTSTRRRRWSSSAGRRLGRESSKFKGQSARVGPCRARHGSPSRSPWPSLAFPFLLCGTFARCRHHRLLHSRSHSALHRALSSAPATSRSTPRSPPTNGTSSSSQLAQGRRRCGVARSIRIGRNRWPALKEHSFRRGARTATRFSSSRTRNCGGSHSAMAPSVTSPTRPRLPEHRRFPTGRFSLHFNRRE